MEQQRTSIPELPSGHIPTLDGLRGLAILLVMLTHCAGSLETGSHRLDALFHLAFGHGWVGVNLFFALSGFLITGILFDSRKAPHYFRDFYARRTLRIFPLYYGILFVAFVILPLIGDGSEMYAELRGRQAWLWSYCANIKLTLFGEWCFMSPMVDLGHFWSLAVEEHFYLVWPLLVYSLSRRGLVRVCIAIIVIAGVSRSIWVVGHETPGITKLLPAYVLTPFRMDDLAMGALLAALIREPANRVWLVKYAWHAVVLGTALLLLALALPELLHRRTLLQTWGYSAISFFFTTLLSATLFAKKGSSLSVVFSSPLLRWFGKYSYGLYIFNSIVFRWVSTLNVEQVLRRFVPNQMAAALLASLAGLGVSMLLAICSWHLYEKHFLKLKKYFEYRARPAAVLSGPALGHEPPVG